MQDKLLDTLVSNLEVDFKQFRKEIEQLRYVVDLKALSKDKIKEITTKLGTELYPEQDYVILKTKGQFDKVSSILDDTQGDASQGRMAHTVIKESAEARMRLSQKIKRKTASIMKYASPEVQVEFSDTIGKRLNRYRIKFAFDKDDPKVLQNRLIESATATIRSELKTLKKGNPIADMVARRKQSIVTAFKTGKVVKDTKKYNKVKRSNKKANTTKAYYTPLRSPTTGLFISTSSLMGTLNILLHDAIKNDFMEDRGAAPDRNYLRYQTGRFARSAQVTHVTNQQGVLHVNYDYMESPYDVFRYAPHGKGRDPQRIVEGAIRSILVQYVTGKFNTLVRKI